MLLSKERIVGKIPYRGHHLVLLQESGTYRISVLDGRNNAVEIGLSTMHSTEDDALDEARRKVDSLVGQRRH
jgi:hypothetical protein